MLHIENNTWTRGDMKFIFECSHRSGAHVLHVFKKYRIFTCENIWIFSVTEILIKHWCLYNKGFLLILCSINISGAPGAAKRGPILIMRKKRKPMS